MATTERKQLNIEQDFARFLARPEFQSWRSHFSVAINRRTDPQRHGDLPKWLGILDQLPTLIASSNNLDKDTIHIGDRTDTNDQEYEQLHQTLYELKPWRKGPYNLFGVFIDTEWRSDWKWQRIAPHINSLKDKHVLDVGCGSGYHCWRMLGAGARYVMGIDPSMRFLIQHMAINQYAQSSQYDFLPLGIEDMPTDMPIFDSVFSMGVLYHRRKPINHLLELKQLMTDGGELILETLIVDDAENGILQPDGRYAQMRNVWSIMTVEKIIALLNEAGFEQGRCVDQNITSLEEQRNTEWMTFHSLKEFLDPNDHTKTIEGYPAPKRGTFIAKKKTISA